MLQPPGNLMLALGGFAIAVSSEYFWNKLLYLNLNMFCAAHFITFKRPI